jgi:hypothetical protein
MGSPCASPAPTSCGASRQQSVGSATRDTLRAVLLRRVLLPMSLLAVFVIGCSDEMESAPPSVQPAPTCEEPGLTLPDGTCIRPGIAPDGCAEGFVHDDEYSCNPTLPAEPCGPGLMAVPGETACRPVMGCGSGRWGDLPIDGATVFVDGSYGGGDSDGSEQKPWPTIQQAVLTAPQGGLIAVAAGTYTEAVRFSGKPVQLWGVCPEKVTIAAPATPAPLCPPAAICMTRGADGSVVGGLSLTGQGNGLAISGALNVVVDSVRAHDNAFQGIGIEVTVGPASVAIVRSLLEQNRDFGLSVSGAQATVEASVLRANLPRVADQHSGRGIAIVSCTSTTEPCPVRANVSVTGTVIEQNYDAGINVDGADLSVYGSVVRTTKPRAYDQMTGIGINIQGSCATTSAGVVCRPTERASASVSRSFIDQNHAGLTITAADATVENSVIRNSLPSGADGKLGRGVSIQLACGESSMGLQCDFTARGTGHIISSVIEQSHQVGLFVTGADATLESSVLRTTQPQAVDQRGGNGMVLQLPCMETQAGQQCEASVPSTATVTTSLIDEHHGFGLMISAADAQLDRSIVRATSTQAAGDIFGDGVAVFSRVAPASITVTGASIQHSARAGLSSFGALVSLSDSHIQCAAFALAGETHEGIASEIVDGGGNSCGCPNADAACKAVSVGLAPPERIDP